MLGQSAGDLVDVVVLVLDASEAAGGQRSWRGVDHAVRCQPRVLALQHASG